MDCLPGYPHLTILSFSPSLPVNSDGLHHLALKRGRGLGGAGGRGGGGGEVHRKCGVEVIHTTLFKN